MTSEFSRDFRTTIRTVVRQGMVLSLCVAGMGPLAAQAQSAAMSAETYFGTVRASDIYSLSYGARGCILEVSEKAKRERLVKSGEMLVKLDDQRSQLAVQTAAARFAELEAAIEERKLAIDSARADERRRKEELELVRGEFERSSIMLGRGLINETAMDAIEGRFMQANFAAERALEAIANAEAAIKRAEIAKNIGSLEMESEQINLDKFSLSAPFDGVLVGFEANVGDCVAEGELAAKIYVPEEKSVDVFFRISRLTAPEASGLAIGGPVKVTRVNGEECKGTITRINTEADPETQFVEATVEVEKSCAPSLFLNESVEIEAVQAVSEAG